MGLWWNRATRPRVEPTLVAREAPSLTAFMTGASGGAATIAGTYVTPDTALRVSAVYACVRLLSGTVAQMPLVLYRRQRNRRRRAEKHPLYALLHDRPNAWQTAFEFKRLLMVHALLRGNAYALVRRTETGQLVDLLPLHPDRVCVRRQESGEPAYDVRLGNGTYLSGLLVGEVMHLRGPSQDGLVGLSPIGLARQGIGLAMAAEEHGARFFAGDAKPGGVLSVPGKLSEERVTAVREQWERQHAGLRNAGRVAILHDGAKFEPVSISHEDAQFIETRRFQVADICRIYGVPPHMVGETDKSTSWGTGIEQQTLGYLKFTVAEWLDVWQQVAARDLLLPSERSSYYARFNTAALERTTLRERYEAHRIALQEGILSPNEVRGIEDLDPYDGGDEYRRPANIVPIDQAPATPSEPPADPAAIDEGT